MYSKFFDNKGALPHHVHHREQHAKLVGHERRSPSPTTSPCRTTTTARITPTRSSACAPAPQRTRWPSACATSPRGTTRSRTCPSPSDWRRERGGTCPAGVLHAPGSLCTYEPQKASDIFAMYQSLTGDTIIPEADLWKNTPPDKVGNIDYMIEVLDWETNVDPNFVAQPLHGAAAGEARRADGGGRVPARTGSRTSPRNTAPRSSPCSRGRPSRSRTAARTA